jgi:hypothetical protein
MSEESGPPPPPSGPVFNPQTGYPVGQEPPAAPPPTVYPYAGQPYPPAPGMPQFPVYVRPDHPRATAAMVVGIVALAGGFTCILPILAAPVAWVLGAQARGQIRRTPQQWGGEGKATAGMVLGIIGTILLLLGILALVVIVVVAINDPTAFDDSSNV